MTSPTSQSTPILTETSNVDARLERIEQSLTQLHDKVDHPEKHENLPKADSTGNRAMLALTFGLVGMKLGGFISAKLGLLGDMARGYSRNGKEGVKEVWETLFTLGKDKAAPQILRLTIRSMAIGTIGGAIGGAVLGWNRGDRLKSPGELFSHPVDSMKKIFASKKSLHTAASQEAPPTPAGSTAKVDSGSVRYEGMMAEAPALEAQR